MKQKTNGAARRPRGGPSRETLGEPGRLRGKPGGNSPATTPHERSGFSRRGPCGARTRGVDDSGEPLRCRLPGVGRGGRCRLHGGASLAGPDSATFQHGRRSSHLLGKTLERYRDAYCDPDLLKIRQDAALAETLLTALIQRLPRTGLQSEALEQRILSAIDTRRRLVAAETKRLAELQQTVSLGQFMTAMRAVAELIREFVTDDKQRREFQRRLREMLLPGRAGSNAEDDSPWEGA